MHQMFNESVYSTPSLFIGSLVDRCVDGAFLEVRHHFLKQISGNKFDSLHEIRRFEGSTHWQAVDGIHVNAGEIRDTSEKIESFFETLLIVLMGFDYLL